MHEKIKEYIYSNRQRLLSVLDELVAVKSVKGEPAPGAPFGRGPRAALDKMLGICRSAGFDTKLYYDVIGTADLCPEDDFPELGILCHLDVVPAEGQTGWKTDPFKMSEKDGILYGRGVIDDKGPLAAAFIAMKCIKDLGIPLKKGVRLIFGTDEENGSQDLELYTAKNRLPDHIFTPDAAFPVINIEKGMMRSKFSGSYRGGSIIKFRGGSIPNAVPDYAECELSGISLPLIRQETNLDRSGAVFTVIDAGKSVMIECSGRSAHASTPESGINAVTALIAVLNRLPLAEGKQKEIIKGLGSIFPFGETDGTNAGLKCTYDSSGALTLVFSIFNMENGKCGGTIDVRFPACMSLAEVENGEKTALAAAGCVFDGYMGDEPHVTDSSSDFVKKLLAAYERVEGTKGECIAVGGNTYVHNIKGGVAFGVERDGTDYNMHGANEYITIEELLKDAQIFAEAIAEICC
ncbi:MAG: Sapep family Mn(2+)-dependent dipeptidase [Ruminiclostridium sp.]|nr:Sapep family Mn(2+)-dependent dipeptidase [Ruminiclostridium sp.]